MPELIMSKERHLLLAQLKEKGLLRDFYLAGGTGLALLLRHRWSEDLDFFSAQEFDSLALVTKLAELGDFTVTRQAEGTVHGFMGKVKVSFLHYPYPLLDEFEYYQGVKIAGLRDIAAMKLVALVQRGTKKDFIDLYCLEKEKFRLEEMISLVEKKFKVPNYQTLIIKAWGYFVDAEQEATPQMFWDISWEEIKAHFLKRQRQFVDYYFNR